jgi:putative transposase
VESSARLTQWKRSGDYDFLSEVSSVPLQQALRHLQAGFANFFAKRAKYPTFKSRKKSRLSAEYTRSAFRWRDGQSTPATMDAPLAIVWSRPLPDGAQPSTVTVSKDAAGRWFVSILVEEEINPLPPVAANGGSDAGITALATLSTGEKIVNPKDECRDRRKPAKAQRALARKAAWYGRTVVAVDRWFPSSKLCSACGTLRDTMPLNVREWTCACGAVHDRDVNAAKNVLAAGPAES